MKILEIEPTPNPNAMKFVVDQQVTQGFVTRSFESFDSAAGVPLAKELFAIDHVISVYFADRWITVTQDGFADWSQLLRELAVPIRAAGPDDVRGADMGPSFEDEFDGELPGMDDPRIPVIQEVLDAQIMPYLQMDGGGLKIVGLIEDELLIRYEGACGTCPASISGTLMAIENLLQVEVDPNLLVSNI